MSRWQIHCGIPLALVLLSGAAHAEGNITFGGGVPAVTETPAATLAPGKGNKAAANAAKPSGQTEQLPGVNRAIFTPVTSDESERTIQSRPIPADLIQPKSTATDSQGKP